MRGRWVAVALAAALTTAGTVVAVRSGSALPGTSLAGRDVAGQDRAELRRTVEALARERSTGTLAVTAGDVTGEVERSALSVDVDATVEQALQSGRDGALDTVLGPVIGGGGPVGLVTTVDLDELTDRATSFAEQVDRPADDGGITVEGVTVTGRPPVEGRALEARPAVDALADALREGAPSVDLPVETTAPATTAEDVTAVVQAATAALGGAYRLGEGDRSVVLTPERLAPLLRTVTSDGALALRVDAKGLTEVVSDQAERLAVDPQEAGFSVVSGAPTVTTQGDLTWTPRPAEVRVVPGRDGRAVDVDAATARLIELVLAAQRDLPRPLPEEVVEAELTTAGAEAAGVRNLIGAFTTSFPAGAPRARNIRRIAELVNGTYVAPGEVLSLNRAAGPRTLARGFVADGAIVDGALTDEVGGGVSQFATTLFNAAFFAGLPIPEHKPHSFYISRYPAGRESTVYFGAIDVKVENDTDSGLYVRTSSTPGSVTVELYGDNGGRRVTSTSGPRRPREDGGFRISVTRTTTGGDGRGGRRVFTTSYDPVPPDERPR